MKVEVVKTYELNRPYQPSIYDEVVCADSETLVYDDEYASREDAIEAARKLPILVDIPPAWGGGSVSDHEVTYGNIVREIVVEWERYTLTYSVAVAV